MVMTSRELEEALCKIISASAPDRNYLVGSVCTEALAHLRSQQRLIDILRRELREKEVRK